MDSLARRQESFRERIDEHSGILFRVVQTYSRNPEDQLDLVQEIKVNLWQAYPKYDPARSFPTWMYRIALNTAISWVRRTEVRRRDTPPPELPVADEPDEKLALLHQLVDRLDEMNRALLLLYMDDLSHAEIGVILGLAPGAVATRISRLKQALREQANQMDKQEWNSTN